MNKEEKIFNKYLVIAVLVILIFSSAVSLHSALSFPKMHDWNYYQLQKIDKNQTNFSFIVFADNKNSITTFNNLIKKVNKEHALFAIDVGDLVLDGEKEYFNFFLSQVKKLNKPLLTVIGNHELYDEGRANYYDIFGQFYYSFYIGKSYFIILDDANENGIDPWQMNWLKNQLKESQNYTYRFVFMHVPLYDPRIPMSNQPGHSLKNLTNARELNTLFDEYNVTMLFCSHIHAYYNGTWGKTPFIITGGGGAELVGTDPHHYFYHYIRVDVSDNGVKYNVIKLKTPPFELEDRLLHTVWLYIYVFFDIHALSIIILATSFYLGYYIVFIKKRWLILNFRKK